MKHKLLAFIIFAFIFGVIFVLKQEYFDKPFLDNDYEFYISSNTSFEEVKNHIDSLCVDFPIIPKLGFGLFLKQKRLEYWFKPGRYIIKKTFSINDCVNKLRSQAQDPVNITFNSMNRISPVFGIAGQKLELDSIDLVHYIDSINLSLDSLTLLLIPNTYEVFWDISPKEFFDRIHFEYNAFWNSNRLEAANKLNLSKQEVFVLASVIDKEASHVDEMPRIAGLYLNRLKQNWFLAADPTIIYAYEKIFNSSIRRVRNKHIDMTKSSSFNTYYHKGLPPFPICIPSFQSLESVLNPEEHKYMYMCARPDNSEYHNFATNYFQHQKNAAAFHKWLNKRKIF